MQNQTELEEHEELGSAQSRWLKYVKEAHDEWNESSKEINEYFE